MLFQVSLMRFHGKALDQHQIRSAEAVRANIIISHQNVTALGALFGCGDRARGQGNKDALLPELYDCRLSHMGTNGFVLSALQLEGSIGFAQTWWCQPA